MTQDTNFSSMWTDYELFCAPFLSCQILMELGSLNGDNFLLSDNIIHLWYNSHSLIRTILLFTSNRISRPFCLLLLYLNLIYFETNVYVVFCVFDFVNVGCIGKISAKFVSRVMQTFHFCLKSINALFSLRII